MQVVDSTPRTTPFDEARRLLAEWEKAEGSPQHLLLIMDNGKDVLAATCGEASPTQVAGLCFAAAHMALED